MKRKHVFASVLDIRSRKKILIFFFVIFILFLSLTMYLKLLVTPLLVDTIESKLSQDATKAMNNSVYRVLNESINYDDLIEIITDASGNISLIHANAVQINVLSRKMIDLTEKNITEVIKHSPINIPLGAFSGIPALAGSGPKINFDIMPYTDVNCDFISEFTSAGINQTHHKIYATIISDVSMVLPFNSVKIRESVKFLVCETIIMGEIPATYLNSASLDEMMNLIP